MKKTLIALAVAASAIVSGSSVAALGGWTESQPNGSIDIGGTITKPVNDMKWLWAVGEGMNNYEHTVAQLSNGGTELTVAVADDLPFLAAKMSKAVDLPIVGGLVPQVQFTSFDQSVAQMTFQDSTSATLTVKVKDANDVQIGDLAIPLTFGAGATHMDVDELGNSSANFARISTGALGIGSIFEGLVQPSSKTNATLALKWSGVTTSDIMDEMIKGIQAANVTPALTTIGVSDSSWMNYSSMNHGNYVGTGNLRYAVYGAGIPAGSELALTFNKAITEETEWKAPVTVNVTYQ